MIDDRPASETALALLSAFRDGRRSPLEVIEASVERIKDVDPPLGAVRTLAADTARAAAEESARRWRTGMPRALEGIPVLVKDLFDTAGTPTSYGAAMFEGHEPISDAAAVRRIRDAGGIVLAKTATHEFGWGITTESAHFGATRNPWNTARSPGGSSGGSAAGLAAGHAPLALGSDTAGSIRVPSAFCGVVGLKPTFAAVDTAGLHPLVGSLDHAGPMATTVEDVALLWSVLRTEAIVPASDVPARLTVGVLVVSTGPRLSVGVADAYESAAAALAGAGHPTQPISSPVLTAAYGTLRDTVLAGGLATHRALGLWPARADEYGDDVRERLELAERLDLDAVLGARAERESVRRAMDEVFHAVDVLLSPVSTTSPAVVGEHAEDYRDRVLTHIAPQSLAGLPALVLRAGFDDDGLPIGVQFTAPPGREDRLLDIGARFQRLTAGVQQRRPRLVPHSTRTTTAGGDPCPSSTEVTTSPCRSAVLRRMSTSTSVSSG